MTKARLQAAPTPSGLTVDASGGKLQRRSVSISVSVTSSIPTEDTIPTEVLDCLSSYM